MVKIMETPIKMDDFGGTIIFGNTHIVDGRNPANQLRLVVDPIIARIDASQVVFSPDFWLPSTVPQTTGFPFWSLLGLLPKGSYPQIIPNMTKHFRYLKWRNPHLCKLYGYGLCKGVFPPQK